MPGRVLPGPRRKRPGVRRRKTTIYKPTPLKPYIPVPLKPYVPAPTKPYVTTPIKPYLPASTKPYIPVPRKPFLDKPRKESIGAELYENEVQALRVIGEAGGNATVRKVARLLGKGPRKTYNACEVLAEADYIDLYASRACRMKTLGWQELEKRGYHFTGEAFHPYLNISYVELQILMAIAEEGGSTSLMALRRTLTIDKDELRDLCMLLGEERYIDLFHSRQIVLTGQGWKELDKGGYVRSEDTPTISDEEFQVLKALNSFKGPSTIRVLAHMLGMEDRRRDLVRLCNALGERDLIDCYQSGQCVLKKKGWEELEKRGVPKPEALQVSLTDEEWRTLEAIAQFQGDVKVRKVAEALGIERREAYTRCEAIAQKEYMDFLFNGQCVIKPRGWRALEQRGFQRPRGLEALTKEELAIVNTIWLAGGQMTVDELTESLNWERRQVGRLVQPLAERDYINLFRRKLLTMSTQGRRVMKGMPPPKPQRETAEKTTPLSADAVLRLGQALAKLSAEDMRSLGQAIAKTSKEGEVRAKETAEKPPMSAAERAAMIRAAMALQLDAKIYSPGQVDKVKVKLEEGTKE